MPNVSSQCLPCWIRTGAVLGALFCGPLAAQPAVTGSSGEEVRMSAETALKVLLGDAAPAMLRPGSLPADAAAAAPKAEMPSAASALRVVVKPGDTVDGLLRRHLADSAFSPRFQRQALMRLNPAVFANGQPQRLVVGSTLWIPTEQILMGLLTGGHKDTALAQANPQAAASPGQDAPGAGRAPTPTPSPTRGWVRFP